MKKLWRDDTDYGRRVSEGVKNALAKPGVLKRRTRAIKTASAQPRSRARRRRAATRSWKNPDYRAKRSEGLTKRWKDRSYRSKQSEARKKRWQNRAYRRKQRRAHARLSKDLKYRTMMSEVVSKALTDPEKSARHLAGRYRAAETLLRQRAATSGAGRPRMEERNRKAAELHARGWSWRDIARKLDSDFAEDEQAAIERMRIAARRATPSNE